MKKTLRTITKTIRRFHDEVPVSKAQKVTERRVWINIENPNGYFERIQAEPGKSLFEEMMRAKATIGGNCNGSDLYSLREKPVEPNPVEPYCLLCWVEILEPWYSKMQVHQIETTLIQATHWIPMGKNKRLACSITVEPWMNEMMVRVPHQLPRDETDVINQ